MVKYGVGGEAADSRVWAGEGGSETFINLPPVQLK